MPTATKYSLKIFEENMREILSTIVKGKLTFFPEPFAIFQYYRHIKKTIKPTGTNQFVMVVDIGGGTFDCAIIMTDAWGNLGVKQSKPLAKISVPMAGRRIDEELLKAIYRKSKKISKESVSGLIQRAEKALAFIEIEKAKIKFCNQLTSKVPNNRTAVPVKIPKGYFMKNLTWNHL